MLTFAGGTNNVGMMKDYTDNIRADKSQEEKEYFTPEEVYELVMSDVKSIYDLKDAV